MKTQLETSMAVRPQPRQISSKSVEQTATQGESVATKALLDRSVSFEAADWPSGGLRVLRIRRSLAFEVRPLLHSPLQKSDMRRCVR